MSRLAACGALVLVAGVCSVSVRAEQVVLEIQAIVDAQSSTPLFENVAGLAAGDVVRGTLAYQAVEDTEEEFFQSLLANASAEFELGSLAALSYEYEIQIFNDYETVVGCDDFGPCTTRIYNAIQFRDLGLEGLSPGLPDVDLEQSGFRLLVHTGSDPVLDAALLGGSQMPRVAAAEWGPSGLEGAELQLFFVDSRGESAAIRASLINLTVVPEPSALASALCLVLGSARSRVRYVAI